MKFRLSLLLGFISLLAFVSTTVYAANNNNEVRPGWGFGDVNHVHTGPPGRSVNVDFNQNNSTNLTQGMNVAVSTGGNTGNATSGDINLVASILNYINTNILSF